MAYDNSPRPVVSNPNDARNKRNNSTRNWISLFLLVSLLCTWAYIIWDKNKTKALVSQQENLLSSTAQQRDALQQELEEATMLYDMLKTSNSKKDSTITVRDQQIAEKQSKIQSLLTKNNATAAELKEARSLITSLKGDIETYRQEIEVLKGENKQLSVEKENITAERNRVQSAYDSTQAVIRGKEDVIDIGSTLHASNFQVMGINERKSGKEKQTTTAKKTDKLRISFDLDENRIAQSGTKSLYVCITAPDGSPVVVEALGSGKFRTRDGEDKLYTRKIEVNYEQNKRQKIEFFWKQNSGFATGDYKITVYHNGFKIGEGNCPLKKGGLF